MFLYLTTNGLCLYKDGGRFIIKNPTSNEESESQVPISLIEGIVIFGRIQLSTDVIKACLKGKIPVFFLSKTGSFFGKLDSLEVKNVDLLYNHIKASMDPEISLAYAKIFIQSKIHNSRVMLQRWRRFYHIQNQHLDGYIQRLSSRSDQVQQAQNLEMLRGVEGSAARLYFEALRLIIPDPFSFEGRNRRPPKDPVNSLLSLGYTLLAQTVEMILHIQGLSTQIGFLHQPKDLKSLLVLDVMEMFRARIVDDMVVRLLYSGKIKLDHFHTDLTNEKRPVLMVDEGLKIVLDEYYKVIFKQKGMGEVLYENDFIKIKLIEKTIEVFKKSLFKESHDYEGFKIK